MNKLVLVVLTIFFTSSFISCSNEDKAKSTSKPTLYTIGDSTVKNGQGDGAGGLWGWGDPIRQYFDLEKINHENHARGGTSTRTYRSLGLWEPVLSKLKKGDFVTIQFGHNDNSDINDEKRARGTIKGIGDETEEIDNMLTGKHEVVHSYGWYLKQFIHEIKEKGATPIIISSIPQNKWEDGKARSFKDTYATWARQIATAENVTFIDLNHKMSDYMEKLGPEKVMNYMFWEKDKTHPSAKGAVIAASLVVEGIKENPECGLSKYLLENPVINFPVKKDVFILGDSTAAFGNDSIIGWGRMIPMYFDTTRVNVHNKARGGRSTRTFINEGLLDSALTKMGEGDFALIQFGHNDDSNLGAPKYRGTIHGTGDETETVTLADSTSEVVHTYGWYLKLYIEKVKETGATPIVLSLTPRNMWKDGKVDRRHLNYCNWAKEVADSTGVLFLNINERIANRYQELGPDEVSKLHPIDHTHTSMEGARQNALDIAKAIRETKDCSLRGYIELPN